MTRLSSVNDTYTSRMPYSSSSTAIIKGPAQQRGHKPTGHGLSKNLNAHYTELSHCSLIMLYTAEYFSAHLK